MFKMMLICVLVGSITQVLAVNTFKSIKTPNGGAYAGTFSSGDGVNGGFGGGYSGSTGGGGYGGGGYGAGGYGGGGSGGYGGGSSGGGSFGGGYGGTGSGSYGDNSDYGASAGFGGAVGGPFPSQFGPFPSFESFINPAEFNKVLGSYFEGLQKNYASLYQHQLQSQSELFNKIRDQVNNAKPGTGGGYTPNHASASASYGPNGIHQTASVYPPNPHSPNVDTRFASDNDINSGKPQFFGVSTSSFAESSNIDGVEKSNKGAVTTVNDNGKITTYKSGS